MVDLGMVDSNHCYNHQPEDNLELCHRWRSSGAMWCPALRGFLLRPSASGRGVGQIYVFFLNGHKILITVNPSTGYNIWLVVWNHGILYFSTQLGISSSQLTFTPSFFRGVAQPPITNQYYCNVVAPSYNLVYKPHEYCSYLRIINHSDIGLMWAPT